LGQQQLLLIALAIIIVGIGIALSIQLFRQNAIDRKREILINESSNLASIAIGYYKRPVQFGGGGKKFAGWNIPPSMVSTANGSYTAQIYNDSIVIVGTGNEVVTGDDSIQVRTTVLSDSYHSTIIR
jgi:hypothetical protein